MTIGRPNALVVGSTGALGAAVSTDLQQNGFSVLETARSETRGGEQRTHLFDRNGLKDLTKIQPMSIHALVFAQGVNTSDSIESLDQQQFERIFEANVALVIRIVKQLLDQDLLAENCRIAILSSVWEVIARGNRLSYMVSKAAIGGLVRSLAVDLGRRGTLVNGVLPGPVDTPMTRQMLSESAMDGLTLRQPTRRIVTPLDVARVTTFLVSERNSAITGQSIVVDGGMSIYHDL